MLKSGYKYYIMASLAIIIIAGCADKPATIKGSVKDEDGNSLAGAAVFSVPQRYSTLTDTLGNFSIEGVESGQYSLMAKMGEDSTMVNLGLVEPGQVLITSIVIKKAPPPPPPPPPEPIIEEKKAEPKPKPKPREDNFVDPIHSTNTRVLLLADKEFFEKFEVESSDGLVWELKKLRTSDLLFEGGSMYEGFFAGPSSKYYETAARRCIYDNKLWIYSHGPEQTDEGGRENYIYIPLGLPGNANIDSVVVHYGFPRFPANAVDGSVRFRMVGETASGDIAILVDWQKIDHNTNGKFYYKSVQTMGDNRKIDYITLEINSDGDAVWDAFLVRPLVYFSLN